MNRENKFFNQTQPQTLQIAVILCYIQAAFLALGVLLGGGLGLIGLFLLVGLGAGAYGMANEKKWGYTLALTAAIVQLIVIVAFSLGDITDISVLINLIFSVALVLLIVHPMSREYQRIWFR